MIYIYKKKLIFTYLDAYILCWSASLSLSRFVHSYFQNRINKRILLEFSFDPVYSMNEFENKFQQVCQDYEIKELKIQENLREFLLNKLDFDFKISDSSVNSLNISGGDLSKNCLPEDSDFEQRGEMATVQYQEIMNKIDEKIGQAMWDKIHNIRKLLFSPNQFLLNPLGYTVLGKSVRLQAQKFLFEVSKGVGTIVFDEFSGNNFILSGLGIPLVISAGFFYGWTAAAITLKSALIAGGAALAQTSLFQSLFLAAFFKFPWQIFYGVDPTLDPLPETNDFCFPYVSFPKEIAPTVNIEGKGELPVDVLQPYKGLRGNFNSGRDIIDLTETDLNVSELDRLFEITDPDPIELPIELPIKKSVSNPKINN